MIHQNGSNVTKCLQEIIMKNSHEMIDLGTVLTAMIYQNASM